MTGQVVKHDQGTFDSANAQCDETHPYAERAPVSRQGQVRLRSEIYPPQTERCPTLPRSFRL
jgi:hypothetical protein